MQMPEENIGTDTFDQLEQHAREEVRRFLLRIMQDELRRLNGSVRHPIARMSAGCSELMPALTAREAEVLSLLVRGCTNPQIGAHLNLSAETVKTHVRHIMDKMVVFDRTEAAVKAVQLGLVVPVEESLNGS